jgi:hypothetical protein
MDEMRTWRDVMADFHDNYILEVLEPHARLIFGASDLDGYEGHAIVIYAMDDKVYSVQSSHCSCDGFSFEPEETSLAYFFWWFMQVNTGKARLGRFEGECFNRIVEEIVRYSKETLDG